MRNALHKHIIPDPSICHGKPTWFFRGKVQNAEFSGLSGLAAGGYFPCADAARVTASVA